MKRTLAIIAAALALVTGARRAGRQSKKAKDNFRPGGRTGAAGIRCAPEF